MTSRRVTSRRLTRSERHRRRRVQFARRHGHLGCEVAANRARVRPSAAVGCFRHRRRSDVCRRRRGGCLRAAPAPQRRHLVAVGLRHSAGPCVQRAYDVGECILRVGVVVVVVVVVVDARKDGHFVEDCEDGWNLQQTPEFVTHVGRGQLLFRQMRPIIDRASN